MHDCPECGAACYCCGDIDDCPGVMSEDWVYENCEHCDGEGEAGDYEEDYPVR